MKKKPEIGRSLHATYIYKKNIDGLLYLSYHQREWEGSAPIPENIKRAMKSNGNVVKDYIPIAYRHEVYVLNIEEDKSRFSTGDMLGNKDMTEYKTAYNPAFWTALNIPPSTRFYKKNISELESLFGVPLENQFKYSNTK